MSTSHLLSNLSGHKIAGSAIGYDGDSKKISVKLIRNVSDAEPLEIREGLVQSLMSILCQVFRLRHLRSMCTKVQILTPTRPLNLLQVVEVGMQMTATLHDKHKADFIHLDVKPANIMRCGGSPETRYRLINFGSAVGIGGCLFGGSNGHLGIERMTSLTERRTSLAISILLPHKLAIAFRMSSKGSAAAVQLVETSRSQPTSW